MNELFQNFHFLRPAWLLLAPLAISVWAFWQRSADPLRGWRRQMEPELLNALAIGTRTGGRNAARWLLIGWLLAVVAIAGPTWKLERSPFADDATPLVILLKADVSMLQPDPAPSRIERAHLKIADLAAARAGQPLGLIAYAGSAHLVLPPTRDTKVVAGMANEITPEIMPVQGDRLDLAIKEAIKVLTVGEQGGSMVVLADSVDTDAGILAEVRKANPFPIQFLELNSLGSSQHDSILTAADALNATMERLDIEGADIAAIVRRSSRAPIGQTGELSGRWQEAGYWIVPAIGLLLMMTFRRETTVTERT